MVMTDDSHLINREVQRKDNKALVPFFLEKAVRVVNPHTLSFVSFSDNPPNEELIVPRSNLLSYKDYR